MKYLEVAVWQSGHHAQGFVVHRERNSNTATHTNRESRNLVLCPRGKEAFLSNSCWRLNLGFPRVVRVSGLCRDRESVAYTQPLNYI